MTTQTSSDEFAGLADLMRDEYDAPDPRDPTLRRRRLRGVLIAMLVVLALVAAVGGYAAWALTAPLPAPVESVRTPVVTAPEAVTLDLPDAGSSAVSVAGAEEYLGAEANGIWATSGDNSPRPLASITKLITALVILDARPLADENDPGPTITFTSADNDLYDEYYVKGATIAAMPTGSSMSLREALAAMLIPSASNYADVVSRWTFGSRWAFLEAARAWLAKNGLTGTTIVEPTGIDPGNTSTPTDLIALGRLAAQHPVVAQIARSASANLPGVGTVYNTNSLLGTSGITGLKTGNLGGDTHNLLYTAKVDIGTGTPLSVVGVVMGGASRQSVNDAVVGLLDSVRAGFHDVPVATQGRVVGSYSTAWGASADIVMASDASIFTWSDTPIEVALTTTKPKTFADGEVVGTLTWTAGPKTATADLVIDGTIEPPSEWWRLTHPGELGG